MEKRSSENKTLKQKTIEKLENHPLIVVIIIFMLVLGGIKLIFETLNSARDFFEEKPEVYVPKPLSPTPLPTMTPVVLSTPSQPLSQDLVLRKQNKGLTKNDIVEMIKRKGFNHPFDLSSKQLSASIIGYFPHKFELIKIDQQNYNPIDNVVIDSATHLMWQQSGSTAMKTRQEAQDYIFQLNNQRKFAGYTDWRLPTIEELASLMTSIKTNDCYLHEVFYSTQVTCWSADYLEGSPNKSWVISFTYGFITLDEGDNNVRRFVKAVRNNK